MQKIMKLRLKLACNLSVKGQNPEGKEGVVVDLEGAGRTNESNEAGHGLGRFKEYHAKLS